MSIERHLDQVSDETERLRAALAALGPDDTPPASIDEMSRSRGSRPRTPTTAASTGTALRRPMTAATPSHGHSDAGRAAEDAAAGARGDEQTAPTRGADRALQELRSALAAGLRTSRSE